MGNVAFASLVIFEVSLALGASVVLYFAWWDNIQKTALLPAAHSLGCVDEGAVPHFTLDDAVCFLGGRPWGLKYLNLILKSL